MTHVRPSIPAQRGEYVENPLGSWCLFAKRCTVLEFRNDAVTDGASDDGTSLFAVTFTSRGRHVERLCLVQKLGAYTQVKMVETPIPFVVRPDDSSRTLAQHVRTNRDTVVDLLERHGAILFRGWNVDGSVGFAAVTHALAEGHGVRQDIACSAGPRLDVVPGVFTSNEAPPWEDIPVHHEMAQCTDPPKYVSFFCEVPASNGGCTPLVRSRNVAHDLRTRYPDVAQRIQTRGVRYVREFPATTDMTSPLGKSWRDTFGATTRADAEEKLTRLGYEWSWTSDDASLSHLRTIGPPRSILIGDSLTTPERLFTAAESVFVPPRPGRPEKSFVYGDGTPLDDECVRAFRSVGRRAFERAHRFVWTTGDVLILNNETVMHARDTFTPPRRILVSLVGCIPGFA